MIRGLVRRLLERTLRGRMQQQDERLPPASLIPPDLPIPYSWVLTNRLAIGPMPASEAQWLQLEQAGLRSCFSCCYPTEQADVPAPPHWRSDQVPLPDHRQQEPLNADRLAAALDRAQRLLQAGAPLYLHCMAGIERSPLIAIGLTARERQLSLFDAIDWVRRCHPASQPIVPQLELLEQVLRKEPA